MIAIELTNKLAGKEGGVVRFELPSVGGGVLTKKDVIIRIGGGAEAVVDAQELCEVLELFS